MPISNTTPSPIQPLPAGFNPPARGQSSIATASSKANDDFLAADADSQVAMVLEDFQDAYKLLESGSFEEHSGKFVACVNRDFFGVGPDSFDLRMKVSHELKVHPERIAVIRVPDETVFSRF
jgi:hypothetical protein